MAEELGEELDWDMTEAEDSNDFVLVDPGIYPFMVFDLKKERFPGSEKVKACPKATVGLTIDTPDQGLVDIYEGIILNTKMMYKIAQFFKSLGYKPDPETGKVPVDWANVIGKEGTLELDHRQYTKKDGSEATVNNIKRFLDPEEASTQPPAEQTSIDIPEQPPAKTNTSHWSI